MADIPTACTWFGKPLIRSTISNQARQRSDAGHHQQYPVAPLDVLALVRHRIRIGREGDGAAVFCSRFLVEVPRVAGIGQVSETEQELERTPPDDAVTRPLPSARRLNALAVRLPTLKAPLLSMAQTLFEQLTLKLPPGNEA
jgi:hypothetical protein